jgi:type III pantothenate kinase
MNVTPVKLLLDVGNTSLKWAIYSEQSFIEQGVFAHQQKLLATLEKLLARISRPDSIYIANVLGEAADKQLQDAVQNHLAISPYIARSEAYTFGVKNSYKDPGRLGVDRWLALISAHQISKQPILIVDSGSATTFDALSSGGDHLGGMILPGLAMMHESLLNKTAIPRVEFTATNVIFATDTVEAVSAAAIQSTVALTECLYTKLMDKTGSSPLLILTGGNATMLGAQLKFQDNVVYEPELVMKGLALISDSRELK